MFCSQQASTMNCTSGPLMSTRISGRRGGSLVPLCTHHRPVRWWNQTSASHKCHAGSLGPDLTLQRIFFALGMTKWPYMLQILIRNIQTILVYFFRKIIMVVSMVMPASYTPR
ncbi:hypothetical protein E2C01_087434 [Portunus trituberculatus]|uniref:Uncharacterized protein n=1 Tax=Portunus trituberculatus TaxID=210409 RepID=A0A5B7J3B7_PORTR|nr:hypothetical protein [Portunus trituberculatus]